MQVHHLLSFLLLALATLSTSVQGFHEEPSDAVREHMKNYLSEEDVQVMQTEMAWGVQEMRRYKSIRGDWPVRSALTGQKPADDDESSLFRGKSSSQPRQMESIHHEYWNYLISLF